MTPEWCHIIGKKSYIGLSVRDLADLLNPIYSTWYDTIYGVDSEIIHGQSAHMHLSSDGSGFIATSNDGAVFVTLQCAVWLFLSSLRLMQDHVYFGRDFERLLGHLEDDFRVYFHRDMLLRSRTR